MVEIYSESKFVLIKAVNDLTPANRCWPQFPKHSLTLVVNQLQPAWQRNAIRVGAMLAGCAMHRLDDGGNVETTLQPISHACDDCVDRSVMTAEHDMSLCELVQNLPKLVCSQNLSRRHQVLLGHTQWGKRAYFAVQARGACVLITGSLAIP